MAGWCMTAASLALSYPIQPSNLSRFNVHSDAIEATVNFQPFTACPGCQRLWQPTKTGRIVFPSQCWSRYANRAGNCTSTSTLFCERDTDTCRWVAQSSAETGNVWERICRLLLGIQDVLQLPMLAWLMLLCCLQDPLLHQRPSSHQRAPGGVFRQI